MVSTAIFVSWKNSKYPGMNTQICPRMTSPMNGISEGFKFGGASSEPVRPSNDDSSPPSPTSWFSFPMVTTVSMSCLSEGGSCVSHIITLPPASFATLSALRASVMSRKQRRHFSPRFRQLQCQSLYRPFPHLLSHTCLETAKRWARAGSPRKGPPAECLRCTSIYIRKAVSESWYYFIRSWE